MDLASNLGLRATGCTVNEPVLAQIEEGIFETYVPDYFADIALRKAGGTGAFLEGSAAWMQARRAELAAASSIK